MVIIEAEGSEASAMRPGWPKKERKSLVNLQMLEVRS